MADQYKTIDAEQALVYLNSLKDKISQRKNIKWVSEELPNLERNISGLEEYISVIQDDENIQGDPDFSDENIILNDLTGFYEILKSGDLNSYNFLRDNIIGDKFFEK